MRRGGRQKNGSKQGASHGLDWPQAFVSSTPAAEEYLCKVSDFVKIWNKAGNPAMSLSVLLLFKCVCCTGVEEQKVVLCGEEEGRAGIPTLGWWGEGGLPVSLPPQLLMTFLCKPQTLTAVFGHRDQAKPFGCKISTTIELPALRNCLLKVGGVKVKGRQCHCNCQIRAK